MTILATSRETLRVEGESVMRLQPLPVPASDTETAVDIFLSSDAVKLLVDRIRLRTAAFEVTPQNIPLLGTLCRQLEGIPLAIELAAARAHVLSIEQIVARLEDRFRLLASGSRTSLARQRTLLAAIDWSYELLTDEERTVFRRLSVFAGGWTLEAAETVACDEAVERPADSAVVVDRFEILDLLERLVDKSLVLVVERRDDVRYKMLETLRDYAMGKLVESGEEIATRDAQLAWALTLVESEEPLDELGREHDNLRAVLTWSIGEKRAVGDGLRLCALLTNFWCVRGHAREGSRWIEAALGGVDEEATVGRASAHLAASQLSYYLSDIERMKAHCESALRIARSIGDEAVAERALNRLSLALILTGDFERAHTCLAECLAYHERRGDERAIADAWDRLGMLAISEGQYDDARQSYEKAVTAYRRLDAVRELSTSLLNLGEALFYLRRLDDAEERLLESLHHSRDIGFRASTAFALFVLGNVLVERGDFVAARRQLVEAIDIASAIGEVRCVAHTLEAFARASILLAQYDRALRLAGAASRLRDVNHANLAPSERDYLDGYWQRARTAIGTTVAEEFFAAGRELTPQQAVALARIWELGSYDATMVDAARDEGVTGEGAGT